MPRRAKSAAKGEGEGSVSHGAFCYPAAALGGCVCGEGGQGEGIMQQVKDTARATVRMGYDGRVHKTFRGHQARERFDNEVKVLEYLAERGCPFVPRLLEADAENLQMVTTSCGSRVDHLSEGRLEELFGELESYGVRHEDPALRNVTYRMQDGRFCLIDFEFATLLEHPEVSLKPPPAEG